MSLLDLHNSKQLSLFDANSNSALKGADIPLPAIKEVKSKAPSFLTLSATVHALCFLMISALSIPLITKENPEIIQFELEEPLQSAMPSRGENVPATKGGAVEETLSVPSLPTMAESLPEKKSAPAPAQASKTTLTSTKATSSRAEEITQATTQSVAQEPLIAPTLETPELEGLHEAQTLATSKSSAALQDNIEGSLDRELMNHEAVTEIPTSFALDQESTELESLQAIEAVQAHEMAEIANLQASAAHSAENAALAEKEAAAKASSGAGAVAGHGQGNNGEDKTASALAGTPTGVRSLDQLRQMPNNPKPYYDREERRRGDQGTVKFVAFINKLGKPENFKLIQSSGHANLDKKTLAALKTWRFHPGQEGWVELPFKWDLQGGAQEDGGFLRRVGSR